MKTSLSISLLLFVGVNASAQEVNTVSPALENGQGGVVASTVSPIRETPGMRQANSYGASNIRRSIAPMTETDSLHLPVMNLYGQVMPINMYPAAWGGWYNWDLHKGLNVNVGASVFAQFGKNARYGAGFSQNISAMYAVPLTQKLSLAVGGYLNNMYWVHDNYHDAGLSAVLGYKFNEHWEAYLYGQKSLVTSRYVPLSVYDINNVGDRIGAAVKYKFNKSTSIQISVESSSRPTKGFFPVDRPEWPMSQP